MEKNRKLTELNFMFSRAIPVGEAVGSPFEDYLKLFVLNPGDIKGKRVLDIGGGVYRSFARGSRNLNVSIITLEPRSVTEYCDRIDHAPVVGGVWNVLPFKDNSFDIVVSSHSVPLWVQTKKELAEIFQEIDRVLVPGGQARLFPPTNEMFWSERILNNDEEYDFFDPEYAKSKAESTLVGLREIGIQNLTLIPRPSLYFDIIPDRQTIAYKKGD